MRLYVCHKNFKCWVIRVDTQTFEVVRRDEIDDYNSIKNTYMETVYNVEKIGFTKAKEMAESYINLTFNNEWEHITQERANDICRGWCK